MDFRKDHLLCKSKQGLKNFYKLSILVAKIKHVYWYTVWEITEQLRLKPINSSGKIGWVKLI